VNGKKSFTEEEVKKYLTGRLEKFMKTTTPILYGLPMKLRDAGTIINPVVQRKESQRVRGFTGQI
jgi:hypothetical protein